MQKIKHGIRAEVIGEPGRRAEVVSRENLIKFNHEIEEWKPNVSYPHGAIVRYMATGQQSSSNNLDTQYAKRVGGWFNINSLASYFNTKEDK